MKQEETKALYGAMGKDGTGNGRGAEILVGVNGTGKSLGPAPFRCKGPGSSSPSRQKRKKMPSLSSARKAIKL